MEIALKNFLLIIVGIIAVIFVSACSASGITGSHEQGRVVSISSDEQFNAIAVPLSVAGSGEIKRIPFVINLTDGDWVQRLHWMDAKEHQFHYDYLRDKGLTYLSNADFNLLNYQRSDRKFVLGSVVRYSPDRHVVEFWAGDTINQEQLSFTMAVLQKSYYRKLLFRPGSDSQSAAAVSAGVPIDDGPGLASGFFIFNPGVAVGTLRLANADNLESLVSSDIVILSDIPISLDPVAGIISTQTTSPTTHLNVLSRTWNIPNIQDPVAASTHADLIGKKVYLKTAGSAYQLRAATAEEIAMEAKRRESLAPVIPAADTQTEKLAKLSQQRRSDSQTYGAKSANLGFLMRQSRRRDSFFEVPQGFTIPFKYYSDHIQANGIDKQIEALLNDPALRSDRKKMRLQLAALRQSFAEKPVNPDVMKRIIDRKNSVLGNANLFVRSSTNAEDLEGFSGAGLYDTIPNVISDEDLEDAVRQVWGSIWNDAAFFSREATGIDHRAVMAAVIVQTGINADAAGVILTENAYQSNRPDGILISAKKGLGIRVVEGIKIPEQAIYWESQGSEKIAIVSRSQDNVQLKFDDDGGVRADQIDVGARVLSDDTYTRLGRIATQIEKRYGEPADIEWLIVGTKIYLVQVRPYEVAK